jgi:hypothetical protein
MAITQSLFTNSFNTLRCVCDLAFNRDEVAVSEWEDRKSKKIIVPIAMGSQTIHHGVNRNAKQIAVTTCVAASGEHAIPYTTTSNQMVPCIHYVVFRHCCPNFDHRLDGLDECRIPSVAMNHPSFRFRLQAPEDSAIKRLAFVCHPGGM